MNENEQRVGTVSDQKSKIRERYKGISIEELDVIPALPQEDIFATEKEQRVAVYARVSTDDPRQTSSYSLTPSASLSRSWKTSPNTAATFARFISSIMRRYGCGFSLQPLLIAST